MANQITIEIEGSESVVKNINIFDMKTKDETRKIVKRYASNVKKEARNRVPVSPSHRKKSKGKPEDLKNSIKVVYFFQGLGAMIYPSRTKGWHRGIIEAGTGPRNNGRFRGQVKATPYMGPAKEAQISVYNMEMKKLYEIETTEI